MAGHRTVEVVLTAQVNGFLAGMRLAEQEARRAAAGADGARVKFEAQQKSMEVGGKTALAFGAASAAGIALVVKASAEYGAKMAQLRTLSGATTGTMKQLSDAAMQQGQAFGQSALQVADAEIELQKAGRSTAQILGGDLKGALALAAAGQLDVGKATQIGVTALTQFAKEGPSISHVADLLAAGSDKALGSVEDLGMALNQSGLVASQMGVSIEETTGTLAAFAQNGLLGSDAGTSFKTMLLSLQSPSAQAAEQLAKYNIHAYDAEGHFVGMAQLAGQLQAGFVNASQAEKDFAMSTIFGTDAIRAANVLFDEGSAGIRKWTKDVDAQGFAAVQAAGKMDSLQGDLTKLSSSFETGLIKAGTSADGGFRGIVQGATNAVQVVSGIPGPVQGAAVGLTALAGAGALVGGAALLAVPKIAALRVELGKLGVSGRGAAGIVGKAGGLAVGVLALGAAFASAGERATGGAADVAEALNKIKTAHGGIKDADFRGDWMDRTSGFKDALEQSFGNGGFNPSSLTHGLSALTKMVGVDLASGFEKNEKALNGYGQALSAVAEDSLPQATKGFQELVKQAGGGRHAVDLLGKAMPDYREKIVQLLTAQKIQATEQNVNNAMQGKGAAGARILAAAMEAARTSAENQAKGVAELAGSAQGAKGDIDALEQSIEGFGSTTLDARAAQAAMQEAIEKAEKEVGKAGKGINLHTKAGRENDAMLRDLASSTAAAAGKTLKMTGSAKDAENQMKDGRAAFIRAAAAAGIVGQKAQDLADKYGLIPKNIDTAVKVTGYQAAATQAEKFRTLVDALRVGVDVPVRLQPGAVPKRGDGSLLLRPQGNATGGAIEGGPKGVDTHLRMLAGGEHVFTDRDVDAMGGQSAVYEFRKALHEGVEGLAKGGAVRKPARRSSAPAGPAHSIRLSEHGTRLLPGRGNNTEAAALTHHFGGIYDQTKKTNDAIARMARELSKYHGETRTLTTANRREAAAQKTYDAIGGGKKDRGRKKAAKDVLDAAKKHVSALEKTHEKTKARYEDAKSDRDDARQAATTLRQDREDFISAETRNPNRRTEDPLSYVDALRSASRDGNFSPTRRKAMQDAANQYEASLVKLTKSGEDAAKKLDDLKQSSKQMRDSIAGAIRGGFTPGGATAAQQTGSWIERNGIRFQTTTTGASGSGIAAYYRAGAASARTFADALSQLAGRGVNAGLLAEIAGMGTEAGLPIAQALLSADAGDVASINDSYSAIGSAADDAGSTVADANFAKQIADADANADKITEQIKADSEKLRKLLANAYGLKGYASGTDSATPGIHLVGENGPELVGFRGGEKVLRAQDTARWVRGAASAAGSGSGISFSVSMPQSLDLVDAGGGLISTVRVVARDVAVQEIAADALQDAVLMAGGAA